MTFWFAASHWRPSSAASCEFFFVSALKASSLAAAEASAALVLSRARRMMLMT